PGRAPSPRLPPAVVKIFRPVRSEVWGALPASAGAQRIGRTAPSGRTSTARWWPTRRGARRPGVGEGREGARAPRKPDALPAAATARPGKPGPPRASAEPAVTPPGGG